METFKELLKDYYPVFLYSVAAVTGLIGGCSAASHQLLRGKNIRVAVVFAYGIVGLFFGLLFLAHANYLNVSIGLDQLIASCLASGFIGSVMLASSNFTVRFFLKRMGIEIQMKIIQRDDNHDKR